MPHTNRYEHCLAYIDTQLTRRPAALPGEPIHPCVTISREEGARGHAIAAALVDWLRVHDTAAPPARWTLFDRNLIERVLADNDLPTRLAKYMPEDQVAELDNIFGEILHVHPPQWELFEMTCRTILRLAKMGHAVIVGRCGNLLTAHLPHAVHVRLVGSPAARAAHVGECRGLLPTDARHIMEQEDRARARYLHSHFGRGINDPLLYDLILNTDRLDDDAAAALIGERVRLARLRAQALSGAAVVAVGPYR